MGQTASYLLSKIKIQHVERGDRMYHAQPCHVCRGKGVIELTEDIVGMTPYGDKKVEFKKTRVCPNCEGTGREPAPWW